MAIATRIDSVIDPTITQNSLFAAIDAALINAGFVVTQYITVGTDKGAIYSSVVDATKTYGTIYLRVLVTTALAIKHTIFATWTTGTTSGTGNSTEILYAALASTKPVNFVSLNGGSELKLIMVSQESVNLPLGCFSPTNKPAWWDLNSYSYGFIPLSSTFATWRSTTFNPYTNTEYDAGLNSTRMGSANLITNRRDILPGILLYTQSNQGIAGRSSDDLLSCAASGSSRYDVLQIPGDTKQYLILNPASGGLAARIA